uniref:Uncharacterized protein n=1 Tax=Timema tahoe TaxID=61484 RepID=A0A7R9P0C0_9NEOP|nr:unnamed protein product [Timema tahoe]
MNTLLLLSAIILTISGSDGLSVRQTRASVNVNVNDYVDTLVYKVRFDAARLGLAPMTLPDVNRTFDVTLITDFHGGLAMTQGQLTGATTMFRDGDASAEIQGTSEIIFTHIGFKQLDYEYKYVASIMNMGPSGMCRGSITDIVLSLEISVEATGGGAAIHLTNFQISHTGGLTVHLDGALEVITDAISDVITFAFKDVIIAFVSGEIKKAVETAIIDIQQ